MYVHYAQFIIKNKTENGNLHQYIITTINGVRNDRQLNMAT